MYWALLDTEARTIGREVMVCTDVPAVTWALVPAASHKIRHAEKATIVKMKWYIQERAKLGPKGVHQLHELLSQRHTEPHQGTHDMHNYQIGRWRKPYEQLTDIQKHSSLLIAAQGLDVVR